MQASYTTNYLKIYFWQSISFILNFFALFIVVPYLSSNPAIYGLYSICISLSIFLSYADLGFLSAGIKYAAESFAQGDKKREIEVIGFTGFIIGILLSFLMIFFLYCSYNPSLVVKGLVSGKETVTASFLFLILAISIPNSLFQRLIQMIFSIRLQDYITQRLNIFGSILRISSVLFFFTNNSYHIVGYYAFTQITFFVTTIIAFFVARRLYSYDFLSLVKSFRFNKEVFNRVKSLAFSTLFLTICWILYYEIDPFVIGKISGVEKVSLFAVGLTLIEFFRSFFGILFSPFNVRFNHLIGQNDSKGLKDFFFHIIKIFSPIVVFPIICLVILSSPFVLSWVGVPYQNSIIIARWLLLCNLFAFITYPASMLMMGLKRIKEMYWINAIIVVVYWLGVILSYHFWGLKSFAIFKFIAFFVSAIAYTLFSARFLEISITKFIYQIIKSMIIPLGSLLLLCFTVVSYLPLTKSKINLFIVLLTVGVVLTTTFIVQIIFSKEIRKKVKELFYLIGLKKS